MTVRMDDASRNLGRASGSLETVLTRLERGEGTLGKLSANDSLYVELNSAASNLNQLIADIRANPKRYLTVEVF
jgi:phospholipid/cholesterol/gamma-HCH transport system substrate-binding protein